MKKPTAIILAVVLLLGIGAGVFWGTSWKRAIRSAGYEPARTQIVDDYRDGSQTRYRLVRAYRDDQANYLLLQQNRFAGWAVALDGTLSPETGTSSIAFMILGEPVESRFYVFSDASRPTIRFSADELPVGFGVGVSQYAKSYELKFSWYIDTEHGIDTSRGFADLQQLLTDKGLL